MGLRVLVDREGIWLGTILGQRHALTTERDEFVGSASLHDTFHWGEIERIEAIDPWPGFRISTHTGHRDFHPLRVHRIFSFTPDDADLRDFERVTARLLAETEALAEATVGRGWLDVPDRPWERVAELPGDERSQQGGAYRTPGDRVLARRPRPGPFEAMLTWLASSPEKPWRGTTREVVMTLDHLYVEHWDRTRWRVPVATLRTRLSNEYDDVVWVFARRNFLILPHRKGCPVTERLERRLAAS